MILMYDFIGNIAYHNDHTQLHTWSPAEQLTVNVYTAD